MSSDTSAKAKGYVGHIVEELKDETTVLAKTGGSAVVSFAWLWPIRGLLYTVTHPQIILSVRTSLVKSLISSAAVFGALALLTYAPQAALLTLVTGPFGPILALFLLGAESIFVLSFFAKPLFLEPTLQQVFDSTLLAAGQKQLVKDGKTRSRGASAGGHALLRPLIALSQGGIARYLITLPLNLIPILGTVFFVLINGHRAGPSWHARYFQLKGFDAPQRQAFIDKYQAEYTAFGIAALLFSFIPVVGLVFTFTNTVGAALWAAQLEAGQNVLEPPAAPTSATTDTSKKTE